MYIHDLCEVAKREMKEKNDGDLGSWKRAVTTADGTWQTRGWHSNSKSFLEGSNKPLSLQSYICTAGIM